jgi:hypothetical protein
MSATISDRSRPAIPADVGRVGGSPVGRMARRAVLLADGRDGKPLDGANRYLLHFEKGQTPPTNATWSTTVSF